MPTPMNLDNSDDELIGKLQDGDISAFDGLYKNYNLKIYYFSLKYLQSDEEAREVVQTVFLRIWENRKTIRKENSLHAYVFTICYNEICKLFRKRSYQYKFLESKLKEDFNPDNEPEDGLHYKTILNKVYQYINRLPEKQKKAFLKSRVEGKSTKEIACEMDLTPGTVDNYISDTQKYLKAKFRNIITIH